LQRMVADLHERRAGVKRSLEQAQAVTRRLIADADTRLQHVRAQMARSRQHIASHSARRAC